MNAKRILLITLLGFLPASTIALNLSQSPLYLSESGTPLVMLTMERDHKLYYEAYNDASDINGDSILDIRYKPAITYSAISIRISATVMVLASSPPLLSQLTSNAVGHGAVII